MSIWLLNNISKLLGIILYPVRLIPKKKFKKEIDIDALCNNAVYGIVRKSLRSKNKTFDNFGSVRQDALVGEYKPEKEVPGLSFNLLGLFKEYHVAFHVL